jgi:hypothetical protein
MKDKRFGTRLLLDRDHAFGPLDAVTAIHQSVCSPMGPGHAGALGGGSFVARASDPARKSRPEWSVTVGSAAVTMIVITRSEHTEREANAKKHNRFRNGFTFDGECRT